MEIIFTLLVIYLVYLIGNVRGKRKGLSEGYSRARDIFRGRE